MEDRLVLRLALLTRAVKSPTIKFVSFLALSKVLAFFAIWIVFGGPSKFQNADTQMA
jgi:hypothetical protein